MDRKKIMSDLEQAEMIVNNSTSDAFSILEAIKGIDDYKKSSSFFEKKKEFEAFYIEYLTSDSSLTEENDYIKKDNHYRALIAFYVQKIRVYCNNSGDCRYGTCNYSINPEFMRNFGKHLNK